MLGLSSAPLNLILLYLKSKFAVPNGKNTLKILKNQDLKDFLLETWLELIIAGDN